MIYIGSTLFINLHLKLMNNLAFVFFNLSGQMDNVLRSSALSSDINFTNKDVQVYLFNQPQSSMRLIKVTEVTKLANLKDF